MGRIGCGPKHDWLQFCRQDCVLGEECRLPACEPQLPTFLCVAGASEFISLCFSFRDDSEFLTHWVVEKPHLSVRIVLPHSKCSVVVVSSQCWYWENTGTCCDGLEWV